MTPRIIINSRLFSPPMAPLTSATSGSNTTMATTESSRGGLPLSVATIKRWYSLYLKSSFAPLINISPISLRLNNLQQKKGGRLRRTSSKDFLRQMPVKYRLRRYSMSMSM